MIKLLQSNWMCALVGTLLYWGTTVAMWKAPHIVLRAALADDGADLAKPSWEFENPELEQLVADLKRQREDLALREQQAQGLELRLHAEREELNVLTQTVAHLQMEFDRNVVRVREDEAANLKRLAKIYATMAPDKAATVFKEMKDDDIVKILAFMKENETAPILELITDPKRVAQITERLRLVLARK